MTNGLQEIEQLVIELSAALRDEILPHIGSAHAKTHAGIAVGGDVTFSIDEQAESLLVDFLNDRRANVAMYSEDRGLLKFGEPEHVLIIDPIDGTRPAAAGLESCMVSIAVAEFKPEPTMGDVVFGCLREFKNGDLFTARRGGGVEITNAAGEPIPVLLSQNQDLSRLFWTIGFRGRPAREVIEVLGDLVDASSVDGAVFDLGSATYSLTRIITGQLDAYIDIGPRMIEDVPQVRAQFEAVGKGAILNNSPHDLAAAALICAEAGVAFGDARGCSLSQRLLLGSEHDFQMSCVAAANADLTAAIIEAVDAGMDKLKAKFGKGS